MAFAGMPLVEQYANVSDFLLDDCLCIDALGSIQDVVLY